MSDPVAVDAAVPGREAIMAVSSPPGRSVRGLVRLSGADMGRLCEVLLDPAPEPRVVSRCRLRLGRGRHLPVVVGWFPGPGSFTGDDVLEIQCPGSAALLGRVESALTRAATEAHVELRSAEAGEFSRRAFEAGRIDLTEAEGIAATISAVSDAQLAAASMLRRGRLGRWAVALVEDLAQALALVEAGIDFVDQDDVVAITPADLLARLKQVRDRLHAMRQKSRSWATLESLPWVVLVGLPNSGKSSLMNALLGRRRAVTSPIAGTTRDVLAEPMRINVEEEGGTAPAEVMLVDAAGIEPGHGEIGLSMQAAAREAIERAELIVELVDERGDEFLNALPAADAPRLRVRSKADALAQAEVAPGAGDADLAVSSVTGRGLSDLRRRIAAILRERAVSLAGQMLALQPRHSAAIDDALAGIDRAIARVEPQAKQPALAEMELVAMEMRLALDALAGLGGRMSPDDVIGKVFATFCVGK